MLIVFRHRSGHYVYSRFGAEDGNYYLRQRDDDDMCATRLSILLYAARDVRAPKLIAT